MNHAGTIGPTSNPNSFSWKSFDFDDFFKKADAAGKILRKNSEEDNSD